MKLKHLLTGLALLSISSAASAQTVDSLKLSLPEAEVRFVRNNYQLIAQKYQTEQAKADIITAKLFDNPEISYENLLYNKDTKKFFETNSTTGQYSAALSQLIRLAGKRNKNIQLAGTGVKLAEYQYFDLLRTLRYTLRSTFYKVYYGQQSAKVYQQQIASLQLLLSASEQQLKLGNVAVKDIIRIKSLLYNLQGEQSSLLNDLEDSLTQLKLLTNIKADTKLALTVDPVEEANYHLDQHPYVNLLDSARNNRADLQLARTGIAYAENNLKLQKANAVPDVELSLTYDLQGNYPERYTGFGVKLPIPLFNRNQGEIKKARIAIDAGNAALQQQESIMENDVFNTYTSAQRTETLYNGFDKNFNADFEKLIGEVIKNFRNRNISLIEFLDFYDSYKASTLQMNNLKYARMNAKEEINYVTGSNVFK
ncbi:MAG: TolC family protein [Pedobacter sp.]|nr:MAG: TolC family protein [Pedobacter sp.]